MQRALSSGSPAPSPSLRTRLALRLSPLAHPATRPVSVELPGPRLARVRTHALRSCDVGCLTFEAIAPAPTTGDLARLPTPPLTADLLHPRYGERRVRIPPLLLPHTGLIRFDLLRPAPTGPDLVAFSPCAVGVDLVPLAPAEHATTVLPVSAAPGVSANVLKPLAKPRVAGKVFRKTPRGDVPLPMLTSSEEREPPARSRREEFARKPKLADIGLDMWDRLLPVLSPPLDLSFADPLVLPEPLYAFQRDGVAFLAERPAALLGDDMGTGKTVQAAVAMSMLFQSGRIRRALVVCPRSVLPNWDQELQKWAPNLSVVPIRANREVRELWWQHSAHVHLTTYETLRQDVDEVDRLLSDFDLVVLDEIHKIKNPKAAMSQACKRIRSTRRWGLSGTPIENRLEDLVSIFDFIEPRVFRAAAASAQPRLFASEESATPEEVRAPLRSAEGVTPTQARELIGPYFLRRRKEDVLDQLPPKVVIEQWPELTESQRAAYDLAESEGVVHLRELGESVTVFHVLDLLGKLKQICNFDPETGESGKLLWLREQLEAMVGDRQDKALVFSQYAEKAGVKEICAGLQEAGHDPIAYYGSMSDAQRREAVAALNGSSTRPVMVLSTKAGGTGLNLQAANYVVHFDHWWNPTTGSQAEDRVHRIGQTKTVFVYHLWAEDTVEQRIARILEEKRRLFEEVIDSQSNVEGTGLTEDELFEVFGLQNPRSTRGQPKDLDGLLRQWTQDCKRHATDFERLVAAAWRAQGYGVRLTQVTRDRGIDILATRQEAGLERRVAVQCKLQSSPVGIGEAQRLAGVVAADSAFSEGVIVTNSEFSGDCQGWSRDQGRLRLVDGAELRALIARLGLTVADLLAR